MQDLLEIFEKNKKWSESVKNEEPDYFEKLAKRQDPTILWIGCSDSRVPATQVCGLGPGEIFTHTNIANQVVPGDLNTLSVIQFGVEVLKVRHIVVCGHYGCGGVQAVINESSLGIVDHWVAPVHEISIKHANELNELTGTESRCRKLVELNIHEQVQRVGRLSIVQNAWKRGQELFVHGLVYELNEGLLKNLNISMPDQP